MALVKVLVTTSSFGKADRAPLDRLLEAGLEPVLNPYGRKLTEAEVSELVLRENPAGMVAGVEPLTASVLEKAHGLKVISRCGIGLDSVDLSAAAALGIEVTNTPDAPGRAVAELTIGMMIGLLRHVPTADRNIRAGEWGAIMGRLLGAQTVGIIGCGRIGRRVAALCRAFGSTVCGYDPAVEAVEGIEMTGIDELLGKSDVVSLHMGYSADTRHFMDEGKLSVMKKGAVIVNASRGGLIDEAALFDALTEGRIAGAALDTFETEPYTGPLRELKQVLMTSHMGSYAAESRSMMEAEAADNLVAGLIRAGKIISKPAQGGRII